jgi:hypothetical protein
MEFAVLIVFSLSRLSLAFALTLSIASEIPHENLNSQPIPYHTVRRHPTIVVPPSHTPTTHTLLHSPHHQPPTSKDTNDRNIIHARPTPETQAQTREK